MNKESILKQIQEAESEISRLKTLIHVDDTMYPEQYIKTAISICSRIKGNLYNVHVELRKEILIELTKENQEMGLYDDTSNPMIK